MVHLVKLFQFPSMATYYHCLTSISLQHSSSSLSVSKSKSNPTYPLIYRTKLSSSSSSFIQCPQNPATKPQIFTVSALVEGEQQQYYSSGNGYSLQEDSNFRNSFKPYELYVCNLPRSCDIPELHNKFKTYGTVQSVEVPRNAETGISRGCGYVTMSSLEEAKAAIAALDGSDVGGREMRVRLSVDMNSKRGSTISSSQPQKNLVSESLISSSRPQKNLVFESPFKMYVGNLAWSVKPEDLRNHFSQFGNVISTKVLHDRKGGKNRVYGFLSFSTSAELEAAMSLDDTEFYGRTIKLREVVKWPEPEP
ncbi:putative RNA recognition motif domain, nucleotide-binding alpha-beta plait domain superfamily [Helianthus annuus]|uniref:Putative nucleotide-binding alpha-beta plait domain-containing protein n=1 Tax=Helianthus annuus TaxID=4232 RepID=A0A251SRB3_HELAN|nr:28 kDa ribonucleoprotein, chloroplastic [Helianthus annuus]KAF5773256.1 putative RNA recognition motif domain, nucleotide-binding alpha-beta plait domain superfamily [Helianthus annuus]KAJ0476765.1 putative RNA recognition motif domain, nucleotide-binding alpha-beta plait domain superfamily [Helianthus annuus]KAJ0497591.1 putative RNA recognition motif domain, nucleotide-binding alpha-beta plait domain superfamily [Helianthus annuus]KAJ0663600.1 putative RNA recognition motif domain, nucleot